MQIRYRNLFTTIRTEGAILPPDLLQRISSGGSDLDGLTPESYHLSGERLNEATNRSWSRIEGAWNAFKTARDRLPENDLGTSVTRERWLLPLFQELGYGRLLTARAIEIDGKSYPISHGWQNTPIHLMGFNVDLDRRATGVAGAARSSPHSLVQELLNRSDDHLWAFVSNGLRLRILRDNVSLTRQAYVEFDLEAMMDGEVYADFVLLWLLCHESRVEAERPEFCWLEKWSRTAQEQGTRALDQLRNGVEEAINALGSGFLTHPANSALRQKLQSGELDKQDYYRQLLRFVYRLLFLFVAEDRELLLDPSADEAAKERYTRFYSTARIRQLAERRRRTRHGDLVYGLWLVMEKLGSEDGCPELGLPALGSFLFDQEAMPDLTGLEIANTDLLDAVRALAFITDGNKRRPVDYKNLRSEELGSVYEALLELHPEMNVGAGTFELGTAGGHERKTTGSYYTPDSLVQCLLDSALDPVLDEAIRQNDPEKAILNLKVCDPATGSGHFLIAAAHRMARKLAFIRTGDEEPSPEATRKALRDVIGHCIYGVDINPMAVELCKVSLWMEALEPGKPLSFLDHRIQCGNSLLGATPALLEKGIPDDAFKPIEGDDKALCAKYRKQNKEERQQAELFAPDMQPWERMGDMAASMMSLENIPNDTIEGIRRKQERYKKYVHSASYECSYLWADAWCAAFVWKKTKEFPYPITEGVFRKMKRDPYSVPRWMRDEIKRLADQYQFFHWHLAFPDVFRTSVNAEEAENNQTGWIGGFDLVLGNPPYGGNVREIEKRLSSRYGVLRPNMAKLFISRSYDLLNSHGYWSLLVPKSLTYVASWSDSRELIRDELVGLYDAKEAFESVLLEQVFFVSRKGRRSSYYLAKDIHNPSAPIRINKGSIENTLLCDLSPEDSKIIAKVGNKQRLSDLIHVSRGLPLQSYLTENEGEPVIQGRDIGLYSLGAGKAVICETLPKELREKLEAIRKPKLVFQDIVAFVSRPVSHIKVMGAFDRSGSIVLNTVTVIEAKDHSFPILFVLGLMNSVFFSWLLHRVSFNKAVRTMHLDKYSLSKIPLPELEEEYVRVVIECVKRMNDSGFAFKEYLEVETAILSIYSLSIDDMPIEYQVLIKRIEMQKNHERANRIEENTHRDFRFC